MGSTGQGRLISLDVFRGMTIAGMVLVNNPGGPPVYWPLEHAEWNGLTPTDWIFPFFLFIVGVAISFSLGKRVSERPGRGVYMKIAVRAVSIYLCGAAVSIIPFFQFQASDAPDAVKLIVWLLFAAALFFLLLRRFKTAAVLAAAALAGIAFMNLASWNIVAYNYSTLRIMGVLQRIAVVYLVTSILFLHFSGKQLLGISVAILLGYWALLTLVPVPGCEVTTMNDKACNLAAYIDRLLLTENHIWRGGKVYDPEGILSTLPAIVTAISGVLAGKWLMKGGDASAASSASSEKANGLFAFGVLLLALGFVWNGWFPMNKSLWTSSYVVATSGLSLLVLGVCYWAIDLKGYRRWAWPFEVFGANALALFVFSGIMARILISYRVDGAEGKPVSLLGWVMQNVYLPLASPIDASWMYAVTFILFWLFLMWLLYRRQIYIKL